MISFSKQILQRGLSPVCVSMTRNSLSSLTSVSMDDGIKTITMSSPKTRNAMSLEMLENLRQNIQEDWNDQELRCILLRGEGKVFSAGHNLKEMTSADGYDHHVRIFNSCNELMFTIGKAPVPVIAVVNGIAAAAGCQLVAMCDIAVATRQSKFSTPGASVGIFCSTPGIPLARMVPRKTSAYMLLTGLPIDAEEALRTGLLSKMVETEAELEAELNVICDAIKAKPRGVVAYGKRFYGRQVEMGLKQAFEEGGNIMVNNLAFKDAQEGISAFKQKRKPVWVHTEEKVE